MSSLPSSSSFMHSGSRRSRDSRDDHHASSSSSTNKRHRTSAGSECCPECAVQVKGLKSRWTSQGLTEMITHAMQHQKLTNQYSGNHPIVQCVISTAAPDDDTSTGDGTERSNTAYIEFGSASEAQSILTLDGQAFEGACLQFEPWIRKQGSRDAYERHRHPEQQERASQKNNGGAHPTTEHHPRAILRVYLRKSPLHMRPEDFRRFLNATLQNFGLAKTNDEPVIGCFRSNTSDGFALETSLPIHADHVMYLNGMVVNGTRLQFSRHFYYRGPAPKYNCVEHFEKDRQARLLVDETVNTHQVAKYGSQEASTPSKTNLTKRSTPSHSLAASDQSQSLKKSVSSDARTASLEEYHPTASSPESRTHGILKDTDSPPRSSPPQKVSFSKSLKCSSPMTESRPTQGTPRAIDSEAPSRGSNPVPSTPSRYVSISSSPTKCRTVFLAKKPSSMPMSNIVDFLNGYVRKEGLSEEDLVINGYNTGTGDSCCFDLVSEAAVDQFLSLKGINLRGIELRFKPYRRCEFDYSSINIYLYEAPVTDRRNIMNFLNYQMANVGLCKNSPVVKCWKKYPSTYWVLTMRNADAASKLMSLNGMPWNQTHLVLRRHEDYRGPAPQFPNYAAFEKHFESKLDLCNSNSRCIEPMSACTNTISQHTVSLGERVHEKEDHGNDGMKSEVKSSNFPKNPKQEGAEKECRTTVSIQKQDLLFIKEAAAIRSENARLKEELMRLEKDHVSLKQEYVQFKEENEQFRTNNIEMEATSESDELPIECLDDVNNGAKAEGMQAEVGRISGRLEIAEQQLKSWQLALELEEERQEKRSFEALYLKERTSLQKVMRELKELKEARIKVEEEYDV